MPVSIRPINEDNFIDAFALKLGKGQESFVSHPIRSRLLFQDRFYTPG